MMDYYLEWVKYNYPGRYVFLSECALCGRIAHIGYDPKKDEGYSLEVIHPSHCEKCVDVQRRNPEVFAWVMGVIGKFKRDGEEKHETSR